MARKLLLEAWPEIMAALVAKAKNGRYQEIRLLLELCDLARVDRNQVKEERQRQLCDALMDGLGLRPAAGGVASAEARGEEETAGPHSTR